MKLGTLYIKKGKEKPLITNKHPWVFSGAIHKVIGISSLGSLVDIVDSNNCFIARGYYNSRSTIAARVLTFDESESINKDFFRKRILDSFRMRSSLLCRSHTSVRQIFSESDRLPGLIVDQYNSTAVVQIQTAGIEHYKTFIEELLMEQSHINEVCFRSSNSFSKLEGLSEENPVETGRVLNITENDTIFQIDLSLGQKSGYFLDQKLNRRIVAEKSPGKTVLDVFCYTGGFGVTCARHGASHITLIDSSSHAIESSKTNMELNGISTSSYTAVQGNAFEELRTLVAAGRRYDIVVLDPPKFASKSADIKRACKGYADLNRLALQLVAPGGYLATFTCSGAVSRDLFQKIIFSAQLESGRYAQIEQFLSQNADHPVALNFPESLYLKGCLIKVW